MKRDNVDFVRRLRQLPFAVLKNHFVGNAFLSDIAWYWQYLPNEPVYRYRCNWSDPFNPAVDNMFRICHYMSTVERNARLSLLERPTIETHEPDTTTPGELSCTCTGTLPHVSGQ